MPKVAREVRLLSWLGTEPERRLLERSSEVRAVSEPNWVGTEPVRVLPERSKEVRAVSEPNWVGMASVRLLLERSMEVRAVRLAISTGMAPEKELLERSSEVRARSKPTWEGMLPEMLMALRSRAETRLGLPATVMPAQFCTCRREAEPVPQVRRKLSAARLLLADATKLFWTATRAWQSSTRSLLLPGTRGYTAVSTKVPSAQPASARDEGAPTLMLTVAVCVSPAEDVMRVVNLAAPVTAVAVAVNSQLSPTWTTEVSLVVSKMLALPQVRL